MDGQRPPTSLWLSHLEPASDPTRSPSPPVQAGWAHQVSIDGGAEPLWSRDGRELFFQQGARLMGVRVTPGAAFSAGAPNVVQEGRFVQSSTGTSAWSITPDGSRFLRIQRVEPERATTRIDLVQNWFEEVKAKAASR